MLLQNEKSIGNDTIIINNEEYVYHSSKHACKSCSKKAIPIIDDYLETELKNNITILFKLRCTLSRTLNIYVPILKYYLVTIENISLLDFYPIDPVKEIMCQKCIDKYKYDTEINKITLILLNSLLMTKLFNLMINSNHSELLFEYEPSLITTIKRKLIEFRKDIVQSPINTDWKGGDYYFIKLFGISSILEEYIPIDIYKRREKLFINDSINGHPLASGGWYNDAMNELEDLGVL